MEGFDTKVESEGCCDGVKLNDKIVNWCRSEQNLFTF